MYMTQIETCRMAGRQPQNRLGLTSPRPGLCHCLVRPSILKAPRKKEPRGLLMLPRRPDKLLALVPAPRTVRRVALLTRY